MTISGDVVDEALRWVGTPYVHGASLRGMGCDCIGLLRGVWRALYGAEPEILPPYTPDWDQVGDDLLLAGLARHCTPQVLTGMQPGDVLVFRMTPGAMAKHVAILTGIKGPRARMVHAYWGRAAVESWLGPWWRSRLAAAFSFPEVRR